MENDLGKAHTEPIGVNDKHHNYASVFVDSTL